MSQETLNGLFGWLLIAAAIWMSLLVLHQIGLTTLRVIRTVRTLSRRRLDKIKQRFNDEEERISEEVEPKFDFWWNETGKKVVQTSPTLYENVLMPPGMDVDEIPEQLKAMIAGPVLNIISSNAQEFAVHLASKSVHESFIAEIRRINTKLADDYMEKHEKHLANHRSELADLGIDIDEFEAQFSAT